MSNNQSLQIRWACIGLNFGVALGAAANQQAVPMVISLACGVFVLVLALIGEAYYE